MHSKHKLATGYLLLLAWLLAGLSPANAQNANYRLGPGDTLKIVVFQEDDLSLSAKINTRGSIDYPLIGELNLEGLTLAEAEDRLDSKLRGDYLVDPQISISIAKYRNFYVTGEVRAPGSYEFQPGMTVRQAIAIAGDFTDRASRSKIFIIKEGDKDYASNKTGLNERIGPGDTITVKESLF
jgi:polysaccharide export outer membrane protein